MVSEIMTRHVLECPDIPGNKEAEGSSSNVQKIFRIDVITPLFGGGVTPGDLDPLTIIRTSSIRGHLRFWWRATRGAKYPSADALYKKEGEIFGTTEHASAIRIFVDIDCKGRKEKCADLRGNRPRVRNNLPAYVLFPFLDPIKFCVYNVSFNLIVNYPLQYEQDVNSALWAWINFGGIGARTRRGCGALFCKSFSPTNAGFREWVNENMAIYGLESPSPERDWATIPNVILTSQGTTPLGAWNKVINLYRDFRQQRGNGRSDWPEPESIRTLTHRWDKRYPELHDHPRKAFPRAELGLPIIFHFKDANRGNDPQDTELIPSDHSRMASALILKPIALGTENALPAIIMLRAPQAYQVTLKEVKGKRHWDLNQDSVRNPDFANYSNSPLSGLTDNGSAIDGFLNYARNNGFGEDF